MGIPIFLILLQNIDSGYSLLVEAVLKRTHSLCLEQNCLNYQKFSIETFFFHLKKISNYITWAISRNVIAHAAYQDTANATDNNIRR